jgi:long-subunit acyl-CoA synthetase (AMP-forming)
VIRSIGALLTQRAGRWPDHAVLAQRDAGGAYVPVSWRSFLDDVASLAAFLHERGIGHGDRVAVFSRNSYAMLVWEMAVTSMGAVSVPIFAGYGARDVDYILCHAEPQAIYVDAEQRLRKVEASAAAGAITTIVTLQESPHTRLSDCLSGGLPGGSGDGASGDARGNSGGSPQSASRELFADLVKRVKPSDVCFLQYTSGTTGNPKGVMLTHRNIMSQRKGMSQVWKIPYRSRFLSYLPWHHSFGGLFERFAALYHGATIYLEDSFGKDIQRLIENWRIAKPTQFFSVPKIYLALVTEARGNAEIHGAIFHPKLEFVFTAAAPLPKSCGEYFEAQGVSVVEGWGLTETSPLVTFTTLGEECSEACVGEPIAGCEILITDEDDEILVRGPNVMKGYFKDKQRTEAVIDHLGWLHTGDLGEFVDDGLKIVCRMDNLFKLSNGEKVSSMLVENAMTISSEWVQHALAVGSGEDFVGALVFLNVRSLERWAAERGRRLPSGPELSGDSEIQSLVAAEIAGSMSDFQPKYMRVRAFAIVPGELSIEAGGLTPTMKVVRHRVLDRYKEWCQAIYRPSEYPDKQGRIVLLKRD